MARSSRWRSAHRGLSRTWTDTWVPEILMSVLSFCCLVALIIVLVFANGSAIRVWRGLTLNTLVSILSAAAKASAMLSLSSSISQWRWCLFKTQRRTLIDFEIIDRASRGPLGCFQFIWHSKRGSLLWIGALTVIAAIAFEPFTQQVVQYDSNNVCQASPQAYMPRAQRYSQGQQFTSQVGTPEAGLIGQPIWIAPEFSMQSAILYGLSQSSHKITQQLAHSCPSQNCTWKEPYTSLAVCSRCEDLTHLVKKTNTMNRLPSQLEVDSGGAVVNPGVAFTLPNTLRIDNDEGALYYPSNKSFTSEYPYLAELYMTSFGTGDASRTNVMQDIDTLIWAESIIRIKPDIEPSTALAWPDVPLDAVECALYYCVNSYSSKVANGEVVEHIEEQKSLRRNASSWIPQIPNNLTSSMLNSIAYDKTYSVIPRSDLMLGDGYNISQVAVDSISAYMNKTFARKEMATEPGINGWYLSDPVKQYFPAVNSLLFTVPNLQDTFHGMATSMTNVVRERGDDNLIQEGELCHLATIYRIEWPWIILPICVAIAGSIQLLLSILRTSRTETPIWKSSQLAVLSRGPLIDETLRDSTTLSHMEESARLSKVHLFPGWVHGSLSDGEKAVVHRKPGSRHSESPSYTLMEDTQYSGGPPPRH